MWHYSVVETQLVSINRGLSANKLTVKNEDDEIELALIECPHSREYVSASSSILQL